MRVVDARDLEGRGWERGHGGRGEERGGHGREDDEWGWEGASLSSIRQTHFTNPSSHLNGTNSAGPEAAPHNRDALPPNRFRVPPPFAVLGESTVERVEERRRDNGGGEQRGQSFPPPVSGNISNYFQTLL